MMRPAAVTRVADEQALYGKESFKQAIAKWQESSMALRESMDEHFEVLENARVLEGGA